MMKSEFSTGSGAGLAASEQSQENPRSSRSEKPLPQMNDSEEVPAGNMESEVVCIVTGALNSENSGNSGWSEDHHDGDIFSKSRNLWHGTDMTNDEDFDFEGRREYMEDDFSILVDKGAGAEGEIPALFGVFDGHGGSRASEYCKENLLARVSQVCERSFLHSHDAEAQLIVGRNDINSTTTAENVTASVAEEENACKAEESRDGAPQEEHCPKKRVISRLWMKRALDFGSLVSFRSGVLTSIIGFSSIDQELHHEVCICGAAITSDMYIGCDAHHRNDGDCCCCHQQVAGDPRGFTQYDPIAAGISWWPTSVTREECSVKMEGRDAVLLTWHVDSCSSQSCSHVG
eukprot:748321-Hanusia_phi.AAC.3